jgi:hypothetical protein
MIPVKLFWDTRNRSIFIEWNGFFSFGWENGKPLIRILGFRKSLKTGAKRIPTRFRLAHIGETLSFLSKWKLKKVEGTLSLPDPMLNGLLYGWASAIGQSSQERKIDVTVNFLGENWVSGEASISPKIPFRFLARMCLRLASDGIRRGFERVGLFTLLKMRRGRQGGAAATKNFER